jgi:hypothetical protein
MLCSISGCLLEEVAEALNEAAQARGGKKVVGLREDYCRWDWLKAIEILGGAYQEIDAYPPEQRIPINTFVPTLPPGPLFVVFCEKTDGSLSHVFAVQNGGVVDTYTEGERRLFAPVTGDYAGYGVSSFYVVEKAARL